MAGVDVGMVPAQTECVRSFMCVCEFKINEIHRSRQIVLDCRMIFFFWFYLLTKEKLCWPVYVLDFGSALSARQSFLGQQQHLYTIIHPCTHPSIHHAPAYTKKSEKEKKDK